MVRAARGVKRVEALVIVSTRLYGYWYAAPGGNVRPPREEFRQSEQTYFVTFQTAGRVPFFRHEAWAELMLRTLASYETEFALHDFVIMIDHLHLLFTPRRPVERSIQLVKGGFSFQAKRELQWSGDIWQAGFSDHRIRDMEDANIRLNYIAKNVEALKRPAWKYCGAKSGLVMQPLPQWLKPLE
jgi:putative transposase